MRTPSKRTQTETLQPVPSLQHNDDGQVGQARADPTDEVAVIVGQQPPDASRDGASAELVAIEARAEEEEVRLVRLNGGDQLVLPLPKAGESAKGQLAPTIYTRVYIGMLVRRTSSRNFCLRALGLR